MELLEPLRALIKALGREKREQYHRHVSVGDLVDESGFRSRVTMDLVMARLAMIMS